MSPHRWARSRRGLLRESKVSARNWAQLRREWRAAHAMGPARAQLDGWPRPWRRGGTLAASARFRCTDLRREVRTADTRHRNGARW